MNKAVVEKYISESISWEDYFQLTEKIVAKEISAPIYEDEKMWQYTQANLLRMQNVLKNITINSKLYNELTAVKQSYYWVLITEPWCGDASQIVPAIHTLANCTDKINLRIVLRDSADDLMNLYLTNGGKAIPKLICVNEKMEEELFVWGPRPVALQEIVTANKDRTDISFGEKVRMIHAWYEADISQTLQKEFIDLIKILNK